MLTAPNSAPHGVLTLFIPPYSPPPSTPFTHTPDPAEKTPVSPLPVGNLQSPLPRGWEGGQGPGAPVVRRVPPHPGGLSQAAGTGRGAAPGGAEAGARVAGSERGAQPGRHRVALGRRGHGGQARSLEGCPGLTMNSKKRGRTWSGAAEAPGLVPGGCGPRSVGLGRVFRRSGVGVCGGSLPAKVTGKGCCL